jgi:hypothetical protein
MPAMAMGRRKKRDRLTRATRLAADRQDEAAFQARKKTYDFVPFLCATFVVGTGAAAASADGVAHCASLEPSPQLRGR